MMDKHRNFYTQVPISDLAIHELFRDRNNFQEVPPTWHVLVADIRDSTQAVNDGRHEEVNLVATGCVIAILNLSISEGITVPFFFGGDGATFLIPDSLTTKALSVLEKHNRNVQKNFKFELSLGTYPVKDLYRDGIELKIARVSTTESLVIPIIMGQGLLIAEKLIKDRPKSLPIEIDEVPVNLSGMDCKWDKIKPPLENQEVLSLLIAGCGDANYPEVYSDILEKLNEIYGSTQRRRPISTDKLKMSTSFDRISNDVKMKWGDTNIPEFLKGVLISLFGEFYLRNTNLGKTYLKRMVELSDNLSLDGRINTVITGSADQRKELFKYLDSIEDQGLIKYGFHISEESIMSCYVRNMKTDEHIHFIDGGNGGYTKAANVLKKKLAN